LGPCLPALAIADGVSVVHERIWNNRLSLAMELNRMAARIEIPVAQVAVFRGVPLLQGAIVVGTDPRATAALTIAGLIAEGESLILGVDLLDNAYNSLDRKLRTLGARIERTRVSSEVYGVAHPSYGRLEAF